MVEVRTQQGTPQANTAELSGGFLTEAEYTKMRLVLPHDVAVPIETWAAMLTCLLDRAEDVTTAEAEEMLRAYNERLRREFQ